VFFVASKVFWLLAQPVSLAFLLVLSGWLLLVLHRKRLGHTAVVAGLLVYGNCAFSTVGFLLIGPLEDRFQRPSEPLAEVGTIVMLGGATAGRVSTARTIPELTEAGDRLAETLRLANAYPDARVLLSGGVGLLIAEGEPEAITAQRFFLGMGLAPDRLVLEGASRNTEENAEQTARLLANLPGPVVLVTSAFHMPRSVGLFRAVGIDVIPWPVDYRSSGTEGVGIDLANPILNLNTSGVALREWIGLAAYKITGRIADWLPGPLPS